MIYPLKKYVFEKSKYMHLFGCRTETCHVCTYTANSSYDDACPCCHEAGYYIRPPLLPDSEVITP